jgi:hypothetical protein
MFRAGSLRDQPPTATSHSRRSAQIADCTTTLAASPHRRRRCYLRR